MNLKFLATFISVTLLATSASKLHAQEYFGEWTLDWNSAMSNVEATSNVVTESFISENVENKNNPIWVLGKDSLKVFQNGRMISSATINWKSENQFDIISKGQKSKTHIIEKVDDRHIRMRTRSSDSILFLRRL
jgi:hypothetical protein